MRAAELLGLLNTMTSVDKQRATTEMEPLSLEREHALLGAGTEVNAIALNDLPAAHDRADAVNGPASPAASVIVDPPLPCEIPPDVVPVRPIEVRAWSVLEAYAVCAVYDDDNFADDLRSLTRGARVTILLLSATLLLSLVAGWLAMSNV